MRSSKKNKKQNKTNKQKQRINILRISMEMKNTETTKKHPSSHAVLDLIKLGINVISTRLTVPCTTRTDEKIDTSYPSSAGLLTR